MLRKHIGLIVIVLSCILFSSCFSQETSRPVPHGSLMIVGGGLEEDNARLFKEFIELAGGPTRAKIAVFGVASRTPAQSATYYKQTFVRYGVPEENIWIVPIAENNDTATDFVNEAYWRFSGLLPRDKVEEEIKMDLYEDLEYDVWEEMIEAYPDKSDDELLDIVYDELDKRVASRLPKIMKAHSIMGADEIAKKLETYTGFWFGGGWQGRIRDLLMEPYGIYWGDGPVLSQLRKNYTAGAVIGGSSAGAAMMSDPMIDGGTSLGAVMQGATDIDPYGDTGNERVYLTTGLGFWTDGLAEQHFIKRGRFGRLIVAMLESGHTLGVGADENTAFVIRGKEIEVIGETGIIIIDTSDAVVHSMAPLHVENVRMHYLEDRDRFNYQTGEITFAYFKDAFLKGDEIGRGIPPVNGNIFANDVLIDHMIYDLVDHRADENFGFAYDAWGSLQGVEPGEGVAVRFYKKPETDGVWGRRVFGGKAYFSVFNVYVDIYPTSVNVSAFE